MKKVLLVLLFVISVFGSDDEIGIPAIKDNIIESAVLNTSGKSFYTLKDERLTYWNLSPLKKLKVWEISKPKVEHMGRDIYFIDNYTKVLLLSDIEFMIYNLQTNEIEKKVKFKSFQAKKHENYIYSFSVKEKIESHEYGDQYIIILDVWDAKTLEKIKSINISEMSEEFLPTQEVPLYSQGISTIYKRGNVFFAEDIFYYSMGDLYGTYVFDIKTLTMKKIIPGRYPVFYVNGYMKVKNDVYNTADTSFASLENQEGYRKMHEFPHFLVRLDRYKYQRYSIVGDLVLRRKWGRYYFYKRDDTRKDGLDRIASIKQKNGELTMQELLPRDGSTRKQRVGKMETTQKDFKLLGMYFKNNKHGYKVIPMNKITYEKYNTNLNIQANKWER